MTPLRRFLLGFGLLLAGHTAMAAEPVPETTVGMTGKIEQIVLPGPELEAKPITDRKVPVVLRVMRTFPHGTDFRYDFEYYGLEPGNYDLTQYLVRKDGKPVSALPPIPVKIVPVRPPGQFEPNKLVIDPGPRLGGYWWLIYAGVAIWGLGFLAIVLSFFFPRRKKGLAGAEGKPMSLADRLRPLVEGAMAGRLNQTQLADLERALLAFWRKRLLLEAVEPAAAISTLRAHAEAGPLLAQLESWLHKPGARESVNVAELLKPYRDLPADAAELPTGGAA